MSAAKLRGPWSMAVSCLSHPAKSPVDAKARGRLLSAGSELRELLGFWTADGSPRDSKPSVPSTM